LTLERLFDSPSLSGPSPRGVKLSPDGATLTMLRNRADDRERYDLWAMDTRGGQWRMLVDSKKLGSGAALSEAEKMQRERQRLAGLKGILAYDWTPDGKAILVPLDGDLYLASLDGSVKRLTNSKESELNPEVSPKGKYVSFVRAQQLWAGPLIDTEHAITPGGGTIDGFTKAVRRIHTAILPRQPSTSEAGATRSSAAPDGERGSIWEEHRLEPVLALHQRANSGSCQRIASSAPGRRR
jgi:dipeptidyl aminopeptidase/acylaminoacyl peptidase